MNSHKQKKKKTQKYSTYRDFWVKQLFYGSGKTNNLLQTNIFLEKVRSIFFLIILIC